MGVWMDYVRRKAERWQQTWGEAALAASEKQEPFTLEDVHIDKARLAESAVEYWKQRYKAEKQLIDALVWDTAEYLNHAGQWAPTGTLTCHFCGVVKGHPHSETCRAKGIGE